jgi:Ca2+/Na+ antiporter
LLLFICCRTGYMIKRWEGILFLSLYVLFIALSYGRSL